MTGKNKNRVLLILIAVLVMICAIYFIITKVTASKEAQKESEAAAESEAKRIWVTQIDELTGLSIQENDTQLDFVKENGTWYTLQDKDFPVDQDKMAELVTEYSDVESSRSLVNGDDLSAYGLDTPSMTISVTDGEGNITQLLIGDKVGDEYYLKTADNDTVYTVDATVVSMVSGHTLYDYVKINQLPTVTASQIQNITIDVNDQTYVFEAEDDTETDDAAASDSENGTDSDTSAADEENTDANSNTASDEKSDKSTSDTSLAENTSESETAESTSSNAETWTSLTQALAGMSIDSCVDYNASEETLKTYGLKSPAKRIEYTYENDDGQDTVTIYVGEMTADGTGYYVLQSGSSAVNIISAQSIDGLLGYLQ